MKPDVELLEAKADLTAAVDALIGIGDLVAQSLAHAEDVGDVDETTLSNLQQINLAVWRCRWDYGPDAGKVVAEPKAPAGPSGVGIPFGEGEAAE